MKNIYKLFLVISIFFTSCQSKEQKLYTIRMKMVDGSFSVKKYMLPIDAVFVVYCDRGSYYLAYTNSSFFLPIGGIILKPAVIDFEMLK